MTDSRLVPTRLRDRLPPLGADPQTPLRETMVQARLTDPATHWDWYLLEFDGEGTFFGLIVNRVSAVAGRFSLRELESIGGGGDDSGPAVQCVEDFVPCTVGELAKQLPQLEDVLRIPSPREARNPEVWVELEGIDEPPPESSGN